MCDINYAAIALFGYFIPKVGLSIIIILTCCWITAFSFYKSYYSYFTTQTIEYIEEASEFITVASVMIMIVVFGMFYYSGLCDGNFEHTIANQWFIAIAAILLGIEFTVKPK